MAGSSVRWNKRLMADQYFKRRIVPAVNATLGYLATGMEAHAKTHAPWTDRTGAARRGLHGYTQRVGRNSYAAVLSHGRLVPYAKYLERHRHTAIIQPTLVTFMTRVWPTLRKFMSQKL